MAVLLEVVVDGLDGVVEMMVDELVAVGGGNLIYPHHPTFHHRHITSLAAPPVTKPPPQPPHHPPPHTLQQRHRLAYGLFNVPLDRQMDHLIGF